MVAKISHFLGPRGSRNDARTPHDSRLRLSRPSDSYRVVKHPTPANSYTVELKKRVQSYLDQLDKGSFELHSEPSPDLPAVAVHPPPRMFPETEESDTFYDSDAESLTSDSDGHSVLSADSERCSGSCSAIYCPSHYTDSRWEDSEDSRSRLSYYPGGEYGMLGEYGTLGEYETLGEYGKLLGVEDKPNKLPAEDALGKETVAGDLSAKDLVEQSGGEPDSRTFGTGSASQLSQHNNHQADVVSNPELSSDEPVTRLTFEMLALHLKAQEAQEAQEAEEANIKPNHLNRILMNFKLDQDSRSSSWIESIYHPMWLGNVSIIGHKRGQSEDSKFSGSGCPFVRTQHLDIEHPWTTVPIPGRKIAEIRREGYGKQRKWIKKFLCNGVGQMRPTSSDDLTAGDSESRCEDRNATADEKEDFVREPVNNKRSRTKY